METKAKLLNLLVQSTMCLLSLFYVYSARCVLFCLAVVNASINVVHKNSIASLVRKFGQFGVVCMTVSQR